MKKIHKILVCTLVSFGMIYPSTTFALRKEETIYAQLDVNGKVSTKTITNHLLVDEEKEIQDETKLKNILNMNGNEKFSLNGTSLIWKTRGKDIFYEGETEEELPIHVEVTYFLDDKEMKVNDMIGKKGKVKIVYHFTNSLKNEVKLNGQKQTLYTPFVVTLGTYVDGKNNKNVEVSNGKVVNNGTSEFAVALASPGLFDSIGYKDFKNLDDIILTYETSKFSLNNVYMIATPKLLEEKDFSVFNKMDQLYTSIEELQSNMNQIESGIRDLESGAKKVADGSSVLSSELNRAKESVTLLKNGSITLENGISELKSALKNVQNSLISGDSEASIEKLQYLKNQNNTAIYQMIHASGKTKEELKILYETYNLGQYTGTDTTLLSLKSTYEMILLLEGNNEAIQSTLEIMGTLQERITSVLTTLDSSFTKLYEGSHTLSSGLGALENGLGQLYNGAISLKSGSETLYNGSATLASGISMFNKQGIQSLSAYSRKIKKYSDKADALIQLSQNYNGFTSSNSQKTTFVFKMKSMK